MKRDEEWLKTHCGRMDHGGCGLLVKVEKNRIVRIKGDPAGVLNQGYVCAKGLASAHRLDHPQRLRFPLLRIGDRGQNKWKRISWNEALNRIAERFNDIRKSYGARAVAFCQGMPKGLEHFVLIRLANTFGSPNVVAVQDVCHAPREVTGYHTCGFYPVADLARPGKLVVLWGSNNTATNEEGVICNQLLRALKQGAELMIIDPARTELSARARLHLQIRPGGDLALALAFMQIIITEKLHDQAFIAEHTSGFEALWSVVKDYAPEAVSPVVGLSAEQIRQGARLFANSRPAAIQWGNAIEHRVNAFDTIRAVIHLMTICGNLDLPGGNIMAQEPNVLSLGKFVRAHMIPEKAKAMIHAHFGAIPRLMTVPPTYFRKAVLESSPYPVKAAYIQCANPLMSWADSRLTLETLRRLDFIAVSEIFMTPTAFHADIVLPAATHFEFNDIGHYGLGHGIVVACPKIVDPPADCRPDLEILNELGKRIAPDNKWPNTYQGFLEEVLAPAGIRFKDFAELGYLKGETQYGRFRSAGFPTPDKKVALAFGADHPFIANAAPVCDLASLASDPEFPLLLTCRKDRFYLHSSYRWVQRLRQRSPRPTARLHPTTASLYNIQDQDLIWIETKFGRISQTAKITEALTPGVVQAAYGWWFPENSLENPGNWKKSNYNLLNSAAEIGKEFGTPNIRGLACRIGKEQ